MSDAPGIDARRFIGVDGCPAGWIAAVWAGDDAPPRLTLFQSFKALIAAELDAATVLAVDIPIGLPDTIGTGGRGCDVAARKVLGARQSAVFAVPSRAAVFSDGYAQACAAAFATSDPPRKISKQCFYLFPKIREVDEALQALPAAARAQIIEAHPEVGFWSLNNRQALDLPKKVKSRPFPDGLDLRRRLLTATGMTLPAAAHPPAPGTKPCWPRSKVGEDDILDALVNVTTAQRYAQGAATIFAGDPAHDAAGLP
ncbi:MAG: DUF429 domain-containing protein, partial [Pseudomonadota bacterium]